MEGHGLITLAVVVFGVVLLIAWIVLPFAVIGIKPLLQELLTELQKTNKILAATQAAAGHQESAPQEWRSATGKPIGPPPV